MSVKKMAAGNLDARFRAAIIFFRLAVLNPHDELSGKRGTLCSLVFPSVVTV